MNWTNALHFAKRSAVHSVHRSAFIVGTALSIKMKNRLILRISITCIFISLLPLLLGEVKNCDYNKGTWLDTPLSIITSLPLSNFLFQDYGNIYVLVKSNKLLNVINLEEDSCHKKYAWYENGLSLNTLNNDTKDLVFKDKVDNKYWLDISLPEAQTYFLNNFKELRKDYNNVIHLDDHFAIPSKYGDYREEINKLALEVYKIGGKFSLSVLPQQYALQNYNQDWEYFLHQGYLSEIILQNYVQKNFNSNLEEFVETVKKYKIEYSIGVYKGEINKPLDITKLIDSLKSRNIKYTIFPFRTILFR